MVFSGQQGYVMSQKTTYLHMPASYSSLAPPIYVEVIIILKLFLNKAQYRAANQNRAHLSVLNTYQSDRHSN